IRNRSWRTRNSTRNRLQSHAPSCPLHTPRPHLRNKQSHPTMFTKILYRPALAIVISIILLFLGVLGIETLPVAQFPSVAPPTVMVTISYPGASANVLVHSVLIPLEQSI